MAYRLTPYAYRPGKTLLHRIPAGIKLAGLLLISLFSVASFFPGWSQGTAILLIIAGAVSAGIRPWELLRGSGPLITTALFVIALRSIRIGGAAQGVAFSASGFIGGVIFGAGLLLAFTAGSLLFAVTTMTELRESLAAAESFLRGSKKRKSLSRLSLSIALMLGFLPRFFEIWDETDAAYQARAGKQGLRKILLLIPLITERMITAALETASAMEARGITAPDSG